MKNKLSFLKSIAVGGIIGFINGFFASGGGIAAVLALKKMLKLDDKKAHATALCIILPLTLSGIFVYSKGGFVDFPIITKAAIGGILGSILGARLLSKLPKKYIRLGFGGVMVFAAVRMFFG